MSKQAEAELILKLYDLRREATMREARNWFVRGFAPTSAADVVSEMFGEHSGHFRMVVTYWDMAAALVNHGAISLELFNDVSPEYFAVFSKMEPFLEGIRATMGPTFMKNVEMLVDNTEGGRERSAATRERMKGMMAEIARRQGLAANA